MPRKKRRSGKKTGVHRRRKRLANDYMVKTRKQMTTHQAMQKESFESVARGMHRIRRGRHPTTNEPLPIGEDGAEHLP